MVVNVPSRQIYLLRQQGDVFRVDSTNNLLKHHSRIAVKLEDAIELLRKRDFVRVQSPGKTAHSTETLAFARNASLRLSASSARLRSATSFSALRWLLQVLQSVARRFDRVRRQRASVRSTVRACCSPVNAWLAAMPRRSARYPAGNLLERDPATIPRFHAEPREARTRVKPLRLQCDCVPGDKVFVGHLPTSD